MTKLVETSAACTPEIPRLEASRGPHRAPTVLCAVALLAISGGCAKPFASSSVSEHWRTSMEALAIKPVYPPREDLQVGDVYLVSGERAGVLRKDAGQTLLLHSIDIGDPLAEHYSRRVEFPRSTAAPRVGNEPFAQPSFDSSIEVVARRGSIRPRLVAFPAYRFASVADLSLGDIGTVAGSGISARAASDSSRNVSMSIPVALSYALSLEQIYRTLRTTTCAGIEPAPSTPIGTGAGDSERHAIIVYEVFLARRIAYTYGSVDAAALAAHAVVVNTSRMLALQDSGTEHDEMHGGAEQPSSDGAARSSSDPATDTAAPAPNVDTTGRAPASASPTTTSGTPDEDGRDPPGETGAIGRPDALSSELDRLRENLGRATSDGLTLDASRGNEGTVTLTQTFERPVAIGYRGVRVPLPPLPPPGLHARPVVESIRTEASVVNGSDERGVGRAGTNPSDDEPVSPVPPSTLEPMTTELRALCGQLGGRIDSGATSAPVQPAHGSVPWERRSLD